MTAHGTAPLTCAWFGCSAGVAGDMLLGALLDAGADLSEVTGLLRRLDAGGWSLDVEEVSRGGIMVTRALVDAPDSGHHRSWRTIQRLLADAALPQRLHRRAHDTFAALAEVEGKLHGVPPEDVEFHEVGALDAIVGVVGVCAALEVLGVDDVTASPVATGYGSVEAAHGALPGPAPATARLLVGVPVVGLDVPVELATPTGVALLRTLCSSFGPVPPMTVAAVGFGAGERELDVRPNVVQVLVGQEAATSASPREHHALLLETNVDDVTGEVLAHVIARLLEAGAYDAWVTPIVMKKGRPAHTVSVLGDPAAEDALAGILIDETGSLGLRSHVVAKTRVGRTVSSANIDGHVVRVKVSASGRVKPEFDDAVLAARALGKPVRQVLAMVEADVQARPTGS
ncbi:MAG: nickel pincer cofactor biosynthesis protein LarC [Ilumatobacteraceae bacterium]